MVEKIVENKVDRKVAKPIQVRRIIEKPVYQEKVVEVPEIIEVVKKIEQPVNIYKEEIIETFKDVPVEIETIVQKPTYVDVVTNKTYDVHMLKRYISQQQKDVYKASTEEIGRLRVENMQLKQNLDIVGHMKNTSGISVMDQFQREIDQTRQQILQMEQKVALAEQQRDQIRETVNKPQDITMNVEFSDKNMTYIQNAIKTVSNENGKLQQ